MNETSYNKKRKGTRNIRIIAIILLAFQFIAYIGSLKEKEKVPDDLSNSIAYQLGFNIFLIAAIILFIVAYSRGKQLKRQIEQDEINTLGRNE